MNSVSVIIPTRNEEDNIAELIKRLKLCGDYQILVVDDSDDNTAKVASANGATVLRGQRKGLSQAVLDGIDKCETDYFVVMDADLQHPPEILPQAVEALKYHDYVLMTKHCKEAMANMSLWRKLLSNLGTWATQILLPCPISDPMSGYFGMRRKCLECVPRGEYYIVDEKKLEQLSRKIVNKKTGATELDYIFRDKPDDWESLNDVDRGEWYHKKGLAVRMVGIEGIGFKIGLELMSKARWCTHTEIPIEFSQRNAGVSKGVSQGLQKHLMRLFVNSLSYEVELPNGCQEYYYFYEGNDWHAKWKRDIAEALRNIQINTVCNGSTEDASKMKVLDVGCGSSPNINYLLGSRIGLDIREEALAFMRDYSDAEFKYGSVLCIPERDGEYDMVTCVEILEHLYLNDVRQSLSELTRVLKLGGYLVLATPNYSSILWNIIENAQHILQPKRWTKDHHTKFRREMLSGLCDEYGLTEVRYDAIQKNMDMLVTFRKVGAQ